MRRHHTTMLAALLTGLATMPADPALAAGPCVVTPANAAGWMGSIQVVCTNGTLTLDAKCHFAVAAALSGGALVTFAGTATASGAHWSSTVLTSVQCEVVNSHGQSDYCKHAGMPAACTRTTSFSALEPVTVCVTAFAVSGPTPVQIVVVERTCAAP